MEEISDFFVNDGDVSTVEIHLMTAQHLEADYIKWPDEFAIAEYNRYKESLKMLYGWDEKEYQQNYLLSKSKENVVLK